MLPEKSATNRQSFGAQSPASTAPNWPSLRLGTQTTFGRDTANVDDGVEASGL
jgi:hypothetical protein